MNRALGASGLLVVAIDMTVAPEAPYPACVQYANYAVRWLKANAGNWNGDASKVGVLRVLHRRARRAAPGDGAQRDPRYAAIPLAAAANIDASVASSRCARRSATRPRATRERSAPRQGADG